MQVTTMDVEYSYQSINSHLLSEVEAEGGEGRVGYIWNNFLTQKVPPPRDVFSPSVPTIHKYHCHVVTYVQIYHSVSRANMAGGRYSISMCVYL